MRRFPYWSWPVVVHGAGAGALLWLGMEHVFTIEVSLGNLALLDHLLIFETVNIWSFHVPGLQSMGRLCSNI